MLPNLKRLLLGISLIVLASTVLLLSDLKRRTRTDGAMPHIGLLQHASVVLLDDTVRGMVDSLAENGFVGGKTLVLQKSHPDREVVQVFGAVADPAVAGVCISHDKPLDHPRNLVGIGSFLPVGEAFGIARDMFPGLKRVGVAWNPAEANSRAFTEKARQACQAMNIQLLEANVENSNGVLEAEDSLVARGAQALWIGGDVTVSIAVDAVISVGQKARIPVFSITPGKPDRGTLFDYGADFYQIGKQTGELTSRILRGADPTLIPVTNEVPIHFVVNTTAMKDLKQQWRITDDILRRANVFVDETGVHNRTVLAYTKEQAASSK